MFCTTQWMQRHTTSHLETKNRVLQWGSGGWVAEACTPPNFCSDSLEAVNVSSYLYDLLQICRCKGFCGVQVSEALVTYVVLVLFLLVGEKKCPHST